MKVGILSLGCPKNLVDSEGIISDFIEKGYEIVDEVADADIAIVNTCAFIEDAKRESVDAILDLIQLKKEGRIKNIVVAGCLPQRYEKELRREFKEVDEFCGVREKEKGDASVFSDSKTLIKKQKRPLFLTPPHYAYIKISEGCDNRCRYCTIANIRGPYRSRPIVSILKEVKTLYDNSNGKLRELNLISQDLSYYGMDLYGRLSLAELLKQLTSDSFTKSTRNIKWVRLLYAHPAHINDGLISVIRGNGRICKYIDLPVQHINDKLLKKMGRKVKKKDILALIDKLRSRIPGIAIRSSLIVGLPGETEKEFKELLKFIKDVEFERLGIFIYSREEGTPAYSFKGQVPDKEKRFRLDEAMKLQQEVSERVNARFLGRTLEVLIDEINQHRGELMCSAQAKGQTHRSAPTYIGRTYADAPEVDGQVFVRNVGANGRSPLQIGDFVDVEIVDTLEYDLVGEVRQKQKTS